MKLRRWPKSLILCVLVSIAGVSISAAFLRPRNAVDDSLNRCLIQATVRIAPQGDPIRGCGVIVDQLNGLVVTVADVMGERENASVFFPCLMNGDNVEKGRERAESESAAKVVYRDRVRRLVVLRIEHCPDGTASLPLGTWQCSPGQSLHSVYSHAKDAETTATSWSFSRGHIQQTLMVPHLWSQCHYMTPWMVGIEPKGALCELGTPIVDDDGNLVALGFDSPAGGGGYLAQFYDVGEIRALLEDYRRSLLGSAQLGQ